MALLACAPSEKEVQVEFDAEVARSNACQVAEDCVVVSPGCPLGCWVVVNAQHRGRVERKAQELISDYESAGAACDYGCTEAPAPACVNAKCAAAQ